MALTELQKRARKIDRRLKKAYPDVRCSLDFTNARELLIATILSAQCTDERVNKVTPALFDKYPDAASFANARQAALEKAIHSTGFFRNKTKSIMGCCAGLVEKHGGEVPGTMDELTLLPGIGRKTANVVLANAYGIPSVVVDTHVKRLSLRMGFTKQTDPEKIERDLQPLIPKKEWTDFGHRLIHHGRAICLARKPNCPECPIADLCPSAAEFTAK